MAKLFMVLLIAVLAGGIALCITKLPVGMQAFLDMALLVFFITQILFPPPPPLPAYP